MLAQAGQRLVWGLGCPRPRLGKVMSGKACVLYVAMLSYNLHFRITTLARQGSAELLKPKSGQNIPSQRYVAFIKSRAEAKRTRVVLCYKRASDGSTLFWNRGERRDQTKILNGNC